MAGRYMPWLKWYPYLAQTSFRWKALTLEDRGLFHDLYDLAAMNHPRGELANSTGTISDSELARHVGVSPRKFGALLRHLLKAGLVVRTDTQVLVFPTFKAKQRKGPLRVRPKVGAKTGQRQGENGAQEVEVDEDADEEVEEEQQREIQGKTLIKLYGKIVKPPSHDTSRSQAKKNAAKLLEAIAYADLEQAVKNYAESCDVLDKDAQYRKNAGNFFGREAVYEGFMPDVYECPKPPKPKGGARGKEGAPQRDIHEGPYKEPEKVKWD